MRPLLGLVVAVLAALGGWLGFGAVAGWIGSAGPAVGWAGAVVVLAAAGYVHFLVRRRAARAVKRRLAKDGAPGAAAVDPEWLERAFERNVTWWRTMWRGSPFGWGGRAQRRVAAVLEEAARYVQRLNDRFADPSGRGRSGASPSPPLPGPIGRAATAPPAAPPSPAEPSGANPPDRGHGDEAG